MIRSGRSLNNMWSESNPATAERLTLLIEECSEVIKCATKILRFGPESNKDDSGRTNKDLLENEIGDLKCIINLMETHKEIETDKISSFTLEKFVKLKKYTDYQ